MRKLCYILFLLVMVSCSSRDADIFNGEIIDIKDNAMEKEIEFKEVDLEGVSFGFLSVYDSIAVLMNPALPSYWYQLYNVKTGKDVGQFAMKGNGHKEFISVGPVFNYYFEDNELKALITEMHKEEVHVWNITKSLAENSTVIERTIKMPWRKENKGASFKEFFVKDCNSVYAHVSSISINDYEATVPYYQIRNLETGKITDEICIFKKSIINKHKIYSSESFLFTSDAMKPDGSKIALSMLNVPQLNIIDTGTKEVTGYRLDYGMSLSDLRTMKTLKTYFTRICADDEHIYTVFRNEELKAGNEIPCPNKLYVFDWDGHLVSKITAKHCISEIAVDNVNKVLYTTSFMDEKLYYIKTDELVGK